MSTDGRLRLAVAHVNLQVATDLQRPLLTRAIARCDSWIRSGRRIRYRATFRQTISIGTARRSFSARPVFAMISPVSAP